MKSPSFMRNGRFYTSKCRGMLQNMKVLYMHPPRSLGPYYMHGLIKNVLKKKRECKNL
jgi:hypothetical protein